MGHDREAFEALFSRKNLSPALRAALRIYLYRDNLLNCEYFQVTDNNLNYLLEVIRVLEEQIFLPGDYVVRRGEIGTSMVFVVRGQVCVLVPDPKIGQRKSLSNMAVQTISAEDGGYFGEVALILNKVRTAWVRAETYVLVAILPRRELEKIWRHWPSEKQALIKRAAETAKRDRRRVRKSRSSLDGADSVESKSHTDHISEKPNAVLLGRPRSIGFVPDKELLLPQELDFHGDDDHNFGNETAEESGHRRIFSLRSGASRALSEAAKLSAGLDVNSETSEDTLQNSVTPLPRPSPYREDLSRDDTQDPGELHSDSSLRSVAGKDIDSAMMSVEEPAQACMIRQLSALVHGQGRLQEQVAMLVRQLASLEEATVVLG
jgi:CRP-like cAMP-binding protein